MDSLAFFSWVRGAFSSPPDATAGWHHGPCTNSSSRQAQADPKRFQIVMVREAHNRDARWHVHGMNKQHGASTGDLLRLALSRVGFADSLLPHTHVGEYAFGA